MKKNKVKIQEEIYSHELLWRTSQRSISQATENISDSYYFYLSGLLTSYLAFEAFINFVGTCLYPDLWKREMEVFKKNGIEGKIEKIVGSLKGFKWEKGCRPYQTIKKIKIFRDYVSHGKLQIYEREVDYKKGESPFTFKSEWDDFLTKDSVEIAVNDIQDFCQKIVKEIRKKGNEFIHLHFLHDAFDGPIAHGESI